MCIDRQTLFHTSHEPLHHCIIFDDLEPFVDDLEDFDPVGEAEMVGRSVVGVAVGLEVVGKAVGLEVVGVEVVGDALGATDLLDLLPDFDDDGFFVISDFDDDVVFFVIFIFCTPNTLEGTSCFCSSCASPVCASVPVTEHRYINKTATDCFLISRCVLWL
jgi:hypothetical protein